VNCLSLIAEIANRFPGLANPPVQLTLVITIITAARIEILSALMFFSVLPVMFSVDSLTQWATSTSKIASKQEGNVATKFANIVECLPVIRSSNSGSWIKQRMDAPLRALTHNRRSSNFISSLVQAYFLGCGAVYEAIIIVPLALALIFTDNIDSGDFVTLVSLTEGMVEPLTELGGFMRNATNFSGSVQTIDDLIVNGAALAEAAVLNGSASMKQLSASLHVKDLVFRYNSSNFDVLKGVQLTIQKGTYVVLCGTSGSGKSTLLELLMRFRLPLAGCITWDGGNISSASLESFKSQVSVMFQQTMILQATVRENITFGYSIVADDVDAAVKRAAEMAEIDDTIRALPDGFDTEIGAGTVGGLSGGQLQRICLARSLFRRPSVLLLDEATSALDPVSEAAIIATLVRLRDTEGLTIVSVSHHPSTAVQADQIVVLDDGVIAENGTYEELTQRPTSIFRRLVESNN